MSSEIKIPFARAPNGKMVTVTQVGRGLTDCVCAQCGTALIAAKGQIYRHHFRHHVEHVTCEGARETALHRYAKELICEQMRLRLPRSYNAGTIAKAQMETRLDIGIIPDVFIEYDNGEKFAIEIWVAHQVPEEKIEIYAKHEIPAVEIDLQCYRFADKDDDEWADIILSAADRDWLFPPASVREQRRLEREREIEVQRRSEQAAIEELKKAAQRRAWLLQQIERLRQTKVVKLEVEHQRQLLVLAQEQERNARLQAEREQDGLNRRKERAAIAEQRAAHYRRLRAEMEPPKLQDLIKIHGSYPAIPPEAWHDYDGRLARWKQMMHDGDFYTHEYKIAALAIYDI